MKPVVSAILSPIALLLIPLPAAAYFDPGAGSMALQAAAAGLFSVLYLLRRSWSSVKGALRAFFTRS